MPPNVQSLFPDCVATASGLIAAADGVLYPEESASIAHAVAKRQQEFRAGRICARQALQLLGCSPGPLARQQDGAIAWPEDIVGALAHNETWCAAAVARRSDLAGIGFDIETVARVGPNLWRRILTEEERSWVASLPEDQAQQWAALIFSAKEAVYKCVAGLVRCRIGFMDAVISPETRGDVFAVTLSAQSAAGLPEGLRLQGRYRFYDGAIFTGLVLV